MKIHKIDTQAGLLFDRVGNSAFVRVIQSSMTMLIPVLLIGAFALIGTSFPVAAYQEFLTTGFGSFLLFLFNTLYNVTFRMLAFYMALSIGLNMAQEYTDDIYRVFGSVLTSGVCFAVLVGVFSENFNRNYFGVNGMLMAIAAAMLSSLLYRAFYRKGITPAYTYGASHGYNSAMLSLRSMLFTLVIFVLFQYLLSGLLGFTSVQDVFVKFTNLLFGAISSKFLQGILFVFMSSVLWFFGIHGSDVLNNINEGMFTTYMSENVAAVESGGEALNILSKTFIDIFVLMGGCGTAICLLISLFMFAKHRNNRRLAADSVIPMLFNINETMIFGLPVIFNPILLIPFIITPVICFTTSYLAVLSGLVPVAVHTVEWTTPVLYSGYLATGSFAGSLLQLFNIAVGVAVYGYFVKALERSQSRRAKLELSGLVSILAASEAENRRIELKRFTGDRGALVKTLSLDLRTAMESGTLCMNYQPQFDADFNRVGAEALLRWSHDRLGNIYPPLIIKLAEEDGFLTQLELFVLSQIERDMKRVSAAMGKNVTLSFNLTALSICKKEVLSKLERLSKVGDECGVKLCIEITEQIALRTDDELNAVLDRIHNLGYSLAIDDFSMGSTSLKYLQSGHFNLVKLDGSLVKGLFGSGKSEEIIKSIVYLSKSMGFAVLAEFVETKKLMDKLASLGCREYQGWLYSKALPLAEFEEFCLKKADK